jgi:carbonic anhydrase/acetyltransferase-like protein (isoleucine patch superfamily)
MLRSFKHKKPQIAATAFVSETAYVVGDVEVGEHTNIWPGTVIRGDTGRIIIGNNTSIQDNSVIHSGRAPNLDVYIGDNVQIGHGAVVHAKEIGSNVLIGMNATVLPGVKIGNYCVIGAGCVVNEDTQIPDHSFVVGVPGKIKGGVTAEHLRWIEEASREYAERGSQYKKAGL